MDLQSGRLRDWYFAVGETADCLDRAELVTLPHTWSVDDKLADYAGRGWYRTSIGEAGPEEHRAFLHFEGAYRDTEVYVNGQLAGSHKGSGYTPFTIEITEYLDARGSGEVTVSVDNRYSREALPYDRSFDWASDGGLYRPVSLCRTGWGAILDCAVTAKPIFLPTGERQDEADVLFGFEAEVDAPQGFKLSWKLIDREKAETIGGNAEEGYSLPPRMLHGKRACWHFEKPELHTLRLTLRSPYGSISDEAWVFVGFRELRAEGENLIFNGEKVRLPGMEWMPGSDPDRGMAENWDEQEQMLTLLRDSNAVLTRFHWQQSEDALDWCDRNGLLVQEEIPFWGKQPEGDPEALWPVICQQLEEMITAHRNHPCIVAWGVGNELSAHTEAVRRYIRRAVAEVKRLDSTRLVNYVSNTAFGCPFDDGTADGDVLMINDYIGTWHQGFEQDSAWRALIDAHPGRVFVPSEFGLCEPAFPGGDPERERIFLEKLEAYRALPQVGGTIYFCLNDYRTHMGEDGSGRFRRRVHGSADWKGEPKPSLYTVRWEYAPLVIDGNEIVCRNDIPSYTTSGWYLTDGDVSCPVPELLPGQRCRVEGEINMDYAYLTRSLEAYQLFRRTGLQWLTDEIQREVEEWQDVHRKEDGMED
ncbi:MAG: hypothetical protein IKP40_11425 [Clostridia bacterium]|nr:hypothetical protein [Clostridia bacterium]